MNGGGDDDNFRRTAPEVAGVALSEGVVGWGTWTAGYLLDDGLRVVFGSATLTAASTPVYSNLGKAAGK